MMYSEHELPVQSPSTRETAADRPRSADVQPAFLSETLSDALDHHERRLVLRYLHDREFMVRRRDVAEHLASWEHGTEAAAVSDDQRDDAEIALHHTHFPKLEAADLIEFDRDSEMVDLTPKAESLIPHL